MILDPVIDLFTSTAEKVSAPLSRWSVKRKTEHRKRHGIALSMYIESAPLDTDDLWPKLEAALDMIAEHSPAWIRRMQKTGISINTRRIPGTRALMQYPNMYLDPYLLANFLPAQIASSIVHEATHGLIRSKGFAFDPKAPAREERACRRSELRFGHVIQKAGVPGATEVIDRVAGLVRAPDEQVGVVVDYKQLSALRIITRIKDLNAPRWYKRSLARRAGVLDTEQGQAAFGNKRKS